jgi:ABC-2 type transport system permease protein
MKLALHAEWTKFRTTAGNLWLLGGVICFTIGLGAIADAGASCSSAGCHQDPAKIGLAGVYLGQLLVAIAAVTIISGEYGTGMIRTTLTAMPHRGAVLAAKAMVIGGWAVVAGVLCIVGSIVVGQLVLPGKGFTAAHGYSSLGLTDGGILRAASGSVLYFVLIALLSLGIATAVRDSAAGIGLVLGLLFLFPIALVMVSNPQWHRHLEQIAPMTSGLGIQTTVGVHSLPLTPWAGLGVLGLWAAGALILGAVVLQFRDA